MAIRISGTEIIGDVTAYISLSGTSAVKIPAGTTAQQPTAVAGMLRFNSETSSFEGYNGTIWGSIGGLDDTSKTLLLLAL